MITCPSCGAANDPANRFCDQCGSRLEAPAATATTSSTPVATAPADQPTTAAATCPNCGATVLPGEAFCDECGAALNTAAPVSAEAPTIVAPPPAPAGDQSQPAEGGAVCPACGHANLPGDDFCDNCGAALNSPAPSPTPDATQASTAPEPVNVPIETEAAPAQSQPATDTPAPEVPTIAEPDPSSVAATPDAAAAPAAPTMPEPPAAPEAPAMPTAPDAAATTADRARLESEITRHQTVIAQLEPVETALGDATPQGVKDSLAQARSALSQAQADLDALSAAPAIDLAEMARLESEISRHQTVIAQLEPVEMALGDATPQGVKDSLAQARSALSQAQTDLDSLQGGGMTSASPAQSAPTSAAPVAPVSAPETPAAPAAPAAPAPRPRLVLENGTELALPDGKTEVIIGREDPISGIFPEVDLTGHGGETGGVSRQHARLNRSGDTWTITDLNSTNYTRVDGNKVDPNTPTPVQDGSRLQFGRVAATFHNS